MTIQYTINVDSDGVINPFTRQLRSYAHSLGWKTGEPTSWSGWDGWVDDSVGVDVDREPDTYIGDIRDTKTHLRMVAVAWKRLTKQGGKKRKPLGVRDTVTLSAGDFMYLLYLTGEDMPLVLVQNKWTEKLSVTKTLSDLRAGVEQIYG